MSVWLTIPSKRPPEETTLRLWLERGYKLAIWRDATDPACEIGEGGTFYSFDEYPGYACAVNYLIHEVMARDPGAEWFFAAGDDTEPDMNHTADEIAAQCERYFARRNERRFIFNPYTFGVMQPTGDRWGEHPQAHDYVAEGPQGVRCAKCHREKEHNIHLFGAYSDRVCGSAWIGREFARRVNQGRGPLWPEYFHMGVDEELQAVATKLGVLWQRRDLIQLHRHWGRAKPGETMGHTANMPAFLERANSAAEWAAYKKLYNVRAESGFPGSEVIK